MAPEIFDSKPYSTKADIYSFGVNNIDIILYLKKLFYFFIRT